MLIEECTVKIVNCIRYVISIGRGAPENSVSPTRPLSLSLSSSCGRRSCFTAITAVEFGVVTEEEGRDGGGDQGEGAFQRWR